MARTEVPVTIGCWLRWFEADAARVAPPVDSERDMMSKKDVIILMLLLLLLFVMNDVVFVVGDERRDERKRSEVLICDNLVRYVSLPFSWNAVNK
jgi:hypothetical protein